MKDSLENLPIVSASLQVVDSVEQQNHFSQTENPKLTYDALVVDARLRQSLVTVRSLGRRRLRVAALETTKSVPTFSSRWCQQKFAAPSYEQSPEPYLAYLEQLLDHSGARVLITSSDGTVALIRQYRE